MATKSVESLIARPMGINECILISFRRVDEGQHAAQMRVRDNSGAFWTVNSLQVNSFLVFSPSYCILARRLLSYSSLYTSQ